METMAWMVGSCHMIIIRISPGQLLFFYQLFKRVITALIQYYHFFFKWPVVLHGTLYNNTNYTCIFIAPIAKAQRRFTLKNTTSSNLQYWTDRVVIIGVKWKCCLSVECYTTLLCRACSGTVNYCLPPLSVSHEPRHFSFRSELLSRHFSQRPYQLPGY